MLDSNTTSHAGSKYNSRHIIKVVFVSVLIDLLGFTVILPLFPSLLDFYSKKDQEGLYAATEGMINSLRKLLNIPGNVNINSVLFGGLTGSLFSFLQYLNSPLFGAASDRYGRKPMILLSLMGSAISYAVWGLSKSFEVFLIARIIGGLSEANISISTALIADLHSAADRSKGMAAIGIAFSVGFVFGPLLGACLTRVSVVQSHFYMGPAFFSFCITIVDILYIARYLPETLPQRKRALSVADSFQELSHLLNPFALFKFTAVKSIHGGKKGYFLRTYGLVYFLYLLSFSGLEFTLTFLVHRRFSFTRLDQGKMFALLGLFMAVLQGGYIRRNMVGKEKSLAIMGMLLLIPGFVIIGFAMSLQFFIVGLVFFSCAAASVVPCLSALASGCGEESEKGRVMGIMRSLGALARATGPLIASTMYWLFGPKITYAVGGLFFIIPITLLRGTNKIVKKFD